jgi:hypothetical protein
MPTRAKSRKPTENSQFSGIQIRILTTLRRLRKFLRKLVKLMQSCQIKINVQFSTNMAKRDLIHQQHHDNEKTLASEEVSQVLTRDRDSAFPRPTIFSDGLSAAEIHLRVSSEMTMITFSEILVAVCSKITRTIVKGSSSEVIPSVASAGGSTMISSEVGSEIWVALAEDFQVLRFQAAVWAAQEQASKLQQ